MNRRELLKGTAALAFSGQASGGRQFADRHGKPNVVICFCDQLRSFEVGCYGNTAIRTPNIDRLAGSGCRFDLAVANNPVCVPSRSCLLSGQYSRTCTGAVWNDWYEGEWTRRTRFPKPTLAEALSGAGYHTGIVGKYHVRIDPFVLGFQYAVYPVYDQCERNYGWLYRENSRDRAKFSSAGARELLPDGFDPSFAISKMRDYISQNKTRPFFLEFSILQPHMPIGPGNMPEKYVRMYDPDTVPLRKNVYKKDGTMSYNELWFKIYTIWDYACRSWNNPYAMERKGDRLPNGFDLRDLTAYYYGAVTCADDQIGELMKALEENGLVDNTIVVVSADHGDMLGSHQRFNKSRLFEEAIRVPIIFRYPQGIKPSVSAKQVACTIDIMPTILDLCGVPIPDGVQGRSLLPILQQKRESLENNFAMIETDQYHIGVRTPTHLYGMRLQIDKPKVVEDDRLYFLDLTEDPLELNNLARTNEQADLAAALRKKLTDWNNSTPWLEM